VTMIDLPAVWQATPPRLADFEAMGLKALDERFYWVRGWGFNRPVICRVTMGLRRRDGNRFAPELNYSILGGDMDPRHPLMWESDLAPQLEAEHRTREGDAWRFGRGWRPLEWAGPIAAPEPDADDLDDAAAGYGIALGDPVMTPAGLGIIDAVDGKVNGRRDWRVRLAATDEHRWYAELNLVGLTAGARAGVKTLWARVDHLEADNARLLREVTGE